MLQTPTPRLPGWEWRPVRYRTRVSVFEHLARWQVIHAGVSRKANQDHKCMRPTQSKSRSIKIEIFFERIGRNRSFCFFRFRKVRVGSWCSAAVNIKEERKFAYLVANEERRPSFPGLKRLKRYCGESQKNKIGDAALLPSSKDSVMILHGSQYLLRLVEKSLSKGKTQGKLWMIGTGA